MPAPDWNAVFGGGGTATTPAPVSAQPAAGPNWDATFGAPAAKTGGGGGILGGIISAPGKVIHEAIPTIENTVTGTIRLAGDVVAPGTHPSWGQLAHQWTSIFTKDPFTGTGVLVALEHPG